MPTDQYKLDGDELYERCDNDCCPINGGVGFGKSVGCWGAGCWNGTDAGAVCPHDPQPNQAGSLVNFRFPSCPSNVTNTLPQPECKISADMKQIGYAAAQSSGIKSSGELSREDTSRRPHSCASRRTCASTSILRSRSRGGEGAGVRRRGLLRFLLRSQ